MLIISEGESINIRAGSKAAGKQVWCGAIAESSHLIQKLEEERESLMGNGMLLPTRPHLLTLPKQFHQLQARDPNI